MVTSTAVRTSKCLTDDPFYVAFGTPPNASGKIDNIDVERQLQWPRGRVGADVALRFTESDSGKPALVGSEWAIKPLGQEEPAATATVDATGTAHFSELELNGKSPTMKVILINAGNEPNGT